MNTMVRVPYWRARSASAMTCLISLIPASTAENSMNSALVRFAMIFASVVFPVPGGPQKISEPVSSRSTCVRSGAGNALIASTAASVGAFAWGNSSSHDSALLETLSAGAYTAQVAGQGGDTGGALAEHSH